MQDKPMEKLKISLYKGIITITYGAHIYYFIEALSDE